MGNCFQSGVPNRIASTSLLVQDLQQNRNTHNLTDSEQHMHEFQYRGFNPESSLTHNSNLNPVFPSNNSSPKHRPIIKSNQMIYGNLHEHIRSNNNNNTIRLPPNYNELQRQIDILKQCSNDEIKMLKTRIQILEKHIKQMIPKPCVNDNELKQNEIYFMDTQIQCKYGKNTPIKLCPNILRIIKVNEIYNKILCQYNSKDIYNEYEIWNIINNNYNNKYDLISLITDYCHLLEIHCNNNNLFELKMISLEINDIINNKHKCNKPLEQCICINNTQNKIFKPELLFILNTIHCYLYHYNAKNQSIDNNDLLQKLRDTIMDTNDLIINYNKNPNVIHTLKTEKDTPIINEINHTDTPIINTNIETFDFDKIDIFTLNTNTNNNINKLKPIPMSRINVNTNINIRERHNSVNSVASNLSRQSTPRSISKHSIENESISSLSARINNKSKATIEMSEDRVRKLSGQISGEQIKQLMKTYENKNEFGIDDQDDGLVSPSSPSSNGSSTLDENDKAEIENFKLKLDNNNNSNSNSSNKKERERRGSKHNLLRPKQGYEWDADTMDETVQEMKKQLFHLACNASHIDT